MIEALLEVENVVIAKQHGRAAAGTSVVMYEEPPRSKGRKVSNGSGLCAELPAVQDFEYLWGSDPEDTAAETFAPYANAVLQQLRRESGLVFEAASCRAGRCPGAVSGQPCVVSKESGSFMAVVWQESSATPRYAY